MFARRKTKRIDWLAVWILYSTWASISGWLLSSARLLAFPAVFFSTVLFVLGLAAFRNQFQVQNGWSLARVIHSRFAAPRIWLFVASLALAGGLLYAPTNYDYLTYRFPRVLHWSWHHGWYWIPTVNNRMNYSGTGFEWLMIPQIIIFKTDRLFFLINFISYLFLPSLIFSVFTKLGISGRLSWWWMWLFPCGYCFILQAASTGNDSFAVVYFLASLHFLFRAKASDSARDLFLSCLAIALVTGAKATNVPLVLPWFVLLYVKRTTFLRSANLLVCTICLLVSAATSFLPMALLDIHNTGDFAGDPNNQGGMKLTNPVAAVTGNGFQMMKDNFAPPISRGSISWDFLVPSQLRSMLARDFPRFEMQSAELQMEESAGIGLGLVLVLLVLLLERGRLQFSLNSNSVIPRNPIGVWIAGAGLVALGAYMCKMGSESTSRLIASYYPLLVASVLVITALDGMVVHRWTFRCMSFLAMLSVLPLLILSPARPLFPALFVTNLVIQNHLAPANISRFQQVYSVYSSRADPFKDVLAQIPPEEKILGVVQTGNDSEAPMWRPFGSRQIKDVLPQDSLESLKSYGIHYVLLNQFSLTNRYHSDLPTLLDKWSASLVAEHKIALLVHQGPQSWYLIHIRSNGDSGK